MKEKVMAFMDAMQSNDAARVADWFCENSTLWIPPAGEVRGLSRIRALFRALFNRYDYIEWDVLEILPVSANRCIFICDSRGAMKGRSSYSNRVLTDITFDGDKILRLSDYFKDTAVFIKQPVAAVA